MSLDSTHQVALYVLNAQRAPRRHPAWAVCAVAWLCASGGCASPRATDWKAEDAGAASLTPVAVRAPGSGSLDDSGTEGDADTVAPPAKPGLSTTRFESFIFEQPRFSSFVLGEFRAGARVVRAAEPLAPTANVQACGGRWYALEPAGYVCEGREGVTTNLDDPTVVLMSKHQAKSTEPLPYGYGMSQGSPMYARVPSLAEQQQVEQNVDAYRKQAADQRASTPPEKLPPLTAIPLEPMPPFLESGAQAPVLLPWLPRGKILKGSYAVYQTRLGFLSAFEANGRSWYWTTESLIVPADRIRANKLADFHGVELAKPGQDGVHLPVVWVRNGTAPIFKLEAAQRDGDGDAGARVVALDAAIPLQGYAEIGDKPMSVRGAQYFELLHADALVGEAVAEEGARFLVKTGDVTRIDGAAALPDRVAADDVWVDVSIGKQALVMYKGLLPLFTTLVSSGAGKGHDTPFGRFRIYSKHVTARMDADEKPAEIEGEPPEKAYRFDDVPYVQYLFEGIAFHAAFWHDGFGQPRSHGCINLAPRDAVWLFHHTLPELPEGWHGVNAGRGGIPWGTTVQIGW